MAAAAGVAVDTEQKPQITSPEKNIEAALRDYGIAIVSVICILLGLFLLYLGRPTNPENRPQSDDKGTAVVENSNESTKSFVLQTLASALVSAGAVGAIFEIFNRKANERVLAKLTLSVAGDVAETVSRSTVSAVTAAPAFVASLSEEQREIHLTRFLEAALDPSAITLARSLATQLSPRGTLADFRVVFRPMDATKAQGCELEISYTTSTSPRSRYVYEFFVDTDVQGKVTPDPEAFIWRYRIHPPEDARVEDILSKMTVSHLSIGGRHFESVKDETDSTNGHRRMEFDIPAMAGQSFDVVEILTLPPVTDRAHVYFEPRRLCRGLDISCDMSGSDLLVVPVDKTGANATKYARPAIKPQVQGVRTSEWVLPSAAVFFFFSKSSAAAPGGSTEGLAHVPQT